jgi:L-asparaginase
MCVHRRSALSPAFVLAMGLGAATCQVVAQETQTQQPLVKIVATGGTIANSPEGRMAVDTVLAQIPEVAEHARIEVVDYSRIASSAISVQNWIDISSIVNRIFETEPEVAGIVITHGSNTSEETAYFLSLTLNYTKPVVVTAAQRQQNTLGTEGTRNLFDAIRVAADPAAAGKGAMLVVNEKIHPARDVTKRMTVRVETWESGDAGVLGLVDGDQITFYNEPAYKHTIRSDVRLPASITRAGQLPRVDIIYAYADADGVMAEAAVRAGAQAIVVAGFPTGAVTPALSEALDRLRDRGTIVIMSNRGGLGRISTDNRYISADNLTPQKARVLTMLALARDPSADFVREVLASH